jgi:hypothetical protein
LEFKLAQKEEDKTDSSEDSPFFQQVTKMFRGKIEK